MSRPERKPSSGSARSGVTLRDVVPDDLRVFFEHQIEAEANRMAAFTHEDPSDHAAFSAHWARILGDDAIVTKAVLVGLRVAGHVASFERFGKPEVTYWLGKEHWGKGVATHALSALLKIVTERPMYARAARDNVASIRVLEKCGFVSVGVERAFANARGAEIEELIFELDGDGSVPKGCR